MRISDWSSDVCSSDLWNRYVAVTQMGGEGVFSDPRVGSHLDPGTPGLASDWRPGMVVANGKQDKVSDVLAALQAYQLSIPAPPPPAEIGRASCRERVRQ